MEKLTKLLDLGIEALEMYLGRGLAATEGGEESKPKPAARKSKKSKAAAPAEELPPAPPPPPATPEKKAVSDKLKHLSALAQAYCDKIENGQAKLEKHVKAEYKAESLITLTAAQQDRLAGMLEAKLKEHEEKAAAAVDL